MEPNDLKKKKKAARAGAKDRLRAAMHSADGRGISSQAVIPGVSAGVEFTAETVCSFMSRLSMGDLSRIPSQAVISGGSTSVRRAEDV